MFLNYAVLVPVQINKQILKSRYKRIYVQLLEEKEKRGTETGTETGTLTLISRDRILICKQKQTKEKKQNQN